VKKYFPLLLVAVAAGFLSGQPCFSKSVILTEEKTTATVKKGSLFTIELASNITTGYTYEKSQVYDPEKVQLVKWAYKPPETKLLGAAGQEIFTFKALRPGQTEIRLTYRRPWEKESAGQQTLVFKITIE